MRNRLYVCVEVDETYVGGRKTATPGRSRGRKSVVAVAAEEDGSGIGRIRLRQVPDASSSSLGLHPGRRQSLAVSTARTPGGAIPNRTPSATGNAGR